MGSFTFEYFRKGEEPLFVETIDIQSAAAIWCHVEALALRVGKSPGAFIRVRNEKGQAVVRAGVGAALAWIEKCPCNSCAIKMAAARREMWLGAPPIPACRSLGACVCGNFPADGE